MILCDCLLNNYFEGKKMNRYDSLKKLYSDIEVLESAGLYKAANVLHKKFVKEAQAKSAKDLMTELNMLAQNPTQDFENLVALVERNLDSSPAYSVDEVEAIRRTIQVGKNQRKNVGTFSTTVAPQNQTLSSNPTSSARKPRTNFQLAKSTPNNIEPMPERSDPTETQQQPVAQDNFPNYHTEQSDTADFYQQQNTVPNLKQIEDPIYQQAIKKIANLLNTRVPDNRIIAQNIYEQTIGKFQDERRKKAFADQFQKLVSKNFPQNRPV
jgi:hypothetical protein